MEEHTATTGKFIPNETRNHIEEELGFIAGVLDMLFLIDSANMWDQKSEDLYHVILDARARAKMLMDEI